MDKEAKVSLVTRDVYVMFTWSGGPGLECHPGDLEYRQPAGPHRVRGGDGAGGSPRLPEARPGQPRALPESLP